MPNTVTNPGIVYDNGAGDLIRRGVAVNNQLRGAGVTAYGGLIVSTEGTKPTFSTGSVGFTLPATPTDVVAIYGSATRTIRVLRVVVSGTAATAAQGIAVALIKRSTALAGGTAVNPAVAAFDSNSPTVTATVAHYTALGTPGTSAGIVAARTVNFPVTTSAFSDRFVVDFTQNNSQALVLRGTTQGLVVNLNGVALANATTLSYEIVWTEE